MKEEHKTSKALKGQLLGAISMMLVAAIALGTSTYAWFINNQTVEVSTMNLQVSTSTSLLAAVGKPSSVASFATLPAVDLTNFTPFKTVISNDDIKGAFDADGAGWTNFFNNKMVPSSVCDTELKVTTAAPKFYKSLDKLVGGRVSAFDLLTHDGADVTKDNGLGQGAVKHIRLAMKGSASDLNVYFGRAAGAGGTPAALTDIGQLVVASNVPGDVNTKTLDEQATAIKSVLRVAVVPQPTGKISGAITPLVFQFDTGAPQVIKDGKNNTYYPNAVTGGDALFATKDGTKPREIDITKAGSAKGLYASIATVNSTADDTKGQIASVDALTAQLPTAGNKYIAAVTVTDGVTTVTDTNKTPLFLLKANEDRIVDLYIWLDGTDEDCLNELAQYKFGLTIPFVTNPVAP